MSTLTTQPSASAGLWLTALPVLRPTKNRRTYRVALDPTSVEPLVAHRHGATQTDGVVDGFVLSRDAGRHPWRRNWVTKRFITYRRRAGLVAFRLQDLGGDRAAVNLLAELLTPHRAAGATAGGRDRPVPAPLSSVRSPGFAWRAATIGRRCQRIGRGFPGATFLARVPSVARSADSGTIGNWIDSRGHCSWMPGQS